MLKELKELERKHYVVTIATVLALFGPGFLCLFHYKNNLISSLDVVKLLILSISLTLPLVILNFLVLGLPIIGNADNKSDIPPELVWTIAAVLTTAILYVGLYASFIWYLTFRRFTFVLLGIEVVVAAISFGAGYWVNRKKKSSNKAPEATR